MSKRWTSQESQPPTLTEGFLRVFSSLVLPGQWNESQINIKIP